MPSAEGDPKKRKEHIMSTRRTIRIMGIIIKALLSLFVFSVCALIIWRVFFSTKEPDSIKELYVNEELAEAYAEHGDDLVLKYQNQFSMTYTEDNAGYFGISRYVIIPEANQIQIVLRYNDKTLKHFKEDFDLSEIPEKGEELLDLTLRQIIDLTPEDSADNTDLSKLSITRHKPSKVITDTTALYTYHRIVFDGVEIDEEDVSSIMLDIYFKDAVNYEESAYGALLIYDNTAPWFEYKLTAADKKALKNFD